MGPLRQPSGYTRGPLPHNLGEESLRCQSASVAGRIFNICTIFGGANHLLHKKKRLRAKPPHARRWSLLIAFTAHSLPSCVENPDAQIFGGPPSLHVWSYFPEKATGDASTPLPSPFRNQDNSRAPSKRGVFSRGQPLMQVAHEPEQCESLRGRFRKAIDTLLRQSSFFLHCRTVT